MMQRWNDGGWSGGQWLAMGLMMLVFWTAVVLVVVVFIRRPPGRRDTATASPTHHEAERILNERFARGEIDEDEFTRRRDALRR